MLHTTMLHWLLLEWYFLKIELYWIQSCHYSCKFHPSKSSRTRTCFTPCRVPVLRLVLIRCNPCTYLRVSSTKKYPRLFGRISMSVSPIERSQRSVLRLGNFNQSNSRVYFFKKKCNYFWYELIHFHSFLARCCVRFHSFLARSCLDSFHVLGIGYIKMYLGSMHHGRKAQIDWLASNMDNFHVKYHLTKGLPKKPKINR